MTQAPTAPHLLLEVTRLQQEAARIVSIRLESADGSSLPPFTAGAHIDIDLPNGLRRSYSLCNDPVLDDHYEIAVHHAPQSRGGSEWIHHSLSVGDTLEATVPINNFSVSGGSDILLIAGGIGITPLISMIHQARREGRDWQLFYATRSVPDAAFLSVLKELSDTPDQLQLHFDDEARTHLDIRTCISAAGPSTHIYCCGPEPMLDAFETATAHLVGRAHVERFSAPALTAAESDTNHPFEVHLARSGQVLTVDRDTSILDALMAADIDANYSCEEGVCGTCEVRVLEGEPDHRDVVLSADEKAANSSMMVCVSRCTGRRLVLDL